MRGSVAPGPPWRRARPPSERAGDLSSPPSRRSSGPATLAAGVVALVFVAGSAWPGAAAAQACCASTGLVVPARLRVYEDYGLGVQARARQTYGSFAADGGFGTVAAGDLVTEQDVFVMGRMFSRWQLGLVLPFVETYRRVQAQSEWGGFLGDATVNARVEVVRPGDLGRAPSITVLGGASVPTGRAPDEAHNLLGTDASGTGSYAGTLGIEVEKLWTRWFASLQGRVTWRSSRPAPGGRQSFAPRVGALGVCGYAFAREIAAAIFSSVVREGEGSQPESGSSTVASGVGLVTAGAAGLLPIGEGWRLQMAFAIDVPVAGWGQNMPATVGLDTSLVRAWP